MKKLFLCGAILATLTAQAQLKTPQASTKAQIEQVVGLTEVEVEYARPLKKGRNLFGELVPFDKIWRTGANENTIISFSQDVQFAGQTLPKGKYALYTKPSATGQWEVYFYKETQNWGNPKEWKQEDVALSVTAMAQPTIHSTEAFTIEINPLNYADGEILIRWGNTQVNVPFHTFAIEQAKANIAQSLKGSPSMRDYYSAAAFELHAGGDYKNGLKYINKALEIKKDAPYYVKNIQAELLAKNGKKKEAVKVTKQILEEVKNMGDVRLISELEKAIAQWEK